MGAGAEGAIPASAGMDSREEEEEDEEEEKEGKRALMGSQTGVQCDMKNSKRKRMRTRSERKAGSTSLLGLSVALRKREQPVLWYKDEYSV